MSQEAVTTREEIVSPLALEKELDEFEKKQEEILEVLEILAPENGDKEKYKEEQFTKLFDDAQKVFHIDGQVIIKPELVIEKAKEMLLSRLHSLVEDVKNSERYITDESKSFLLRRARLALLKENDPIWSENWTIEEGSHPNLRDFFHTLNFHLKNERKLNKGELEIITSLGYAEKLIKGHEGLEGYGNFSKVEAIPESLFIQACTLSDIPYVIYQKMLEHSLDNKQKYSEKAFHALVTVRPEYCLKYFKVFSGVDVHDAIDLEILHQLKHYGSTHMYTENIIEMVNSENDSSLLKYITQHAKIEHESYKVIKDIDPELGLVIDNFQLLPIYFDEEDRLFTEVLINEKLTPKYKIEITDAKDLIEKGYLSLFVGNYSKHDFVDYFFVKERKWIMTEAKKYNQEHLIISWMNIEEKQEYAWKLIHDNKISELFLILKEGSFLGGLDQDIFDKLPDNLDLIKVLHCFSHLNQETYTHLSKRYKEKDLYRYFSNLDLSIFERLLNEDAFDDWAILKSAPEYFDLADTIYPTLLREADRIRRFEVIDFYVKNFKDSTEKERFLIRVLINESQTYSEDPDFTIFYVRKFQNTPEKIERDKFKERMDDAVVSLSRNIPLEGFDKEEYKLFCREVYPERNYNSYKFLDEYKDRSEDLDPYKFDKNGYEMKLDGILGYKILEGQTSNEDLLKEYSTRIESIGRLANKSALAEFLKDKNPGQKTKTLEGQIIEYLRNWGYTKDTMNVVLAYQLSGDYEQFVGGSRDRVENSEDEITKQYVMLDELLDRYGDRMKETLKGLKEGIEKSEEDKKQLSENSYIDSIGKIEEKSMKVKSDFEKIPKDKRKDEAFRKKIESTWRTTFQSEGTIQEGATEFAQNFSLSDLEAGNFAELWNSRVQDFFKKLDPGVNLIEVEKLQVQIYQELQKEASKYEEIKEVETEKKGGEEKKSSKLRTIKGYFSKNRENAHARMVGDICLAQDPKMLEDKNYFEFVLFDEERTKCMGTTMLKVLEEPDGKKYLLYCPNPSVGLVSEVSAKKLYKSMTDRVIAFARGNNFDGVVLNKTHGRSTNRAGLFQGALDQSVLKENGAEIVLNLSQIHKLSSYEYKDDLRFVYRK